MNLRPAVAIAASLIVAGCGSTSTAAHHTASPVAAVSSTPTTGASASPSSSTGSKPPPFSTPTPGGPTPVPPVAVSCSSAIPPGHKLALVTLHGVAGIVVRDVTDIAHPVTRCTLGGGSYFRFYDETHVSYIAIPAGGSLGAPGSLYLVDLQSRTTSLVRVWSYGGYASWVYNWSPDGQKLTYLNSDTLGVTWHLLSAAGDRTLSTLGTVPGRGVVPDSDDAMVGFSADGQYVAVEETFTTGSGSPLQIDRVSDGSIAYSRTDGTMATWLGSGATLYFRTSAGVQAWDPSGSIRSVNSAIWIRPWASSDGNRIVFTTVDAQGNHHPGAYSASSGAFGPMVSQPRTGPAFLTSSLVWYAAEATCSPSNPCGMGGPPLTGRTYIYDFGTGHESASIDTGFLDSWPHVVGQS